MTHPLSRRNVLQRSLGGLGGIALQWLLQGNRLQADTPGHDLRPRVPHFAPKAKSIIVLYMGGGPSHIDMFDPKPELNRYSGKQIPITIEQRKTEARVTALGCPFQFSKHGQCGHDMSELVPHLGRQADDIAMLRSVTTDRFDHSTAQFTLATGRPIAGFPSLGSWVTYGLGTENQNLPAFVALIDRQMTIGDRLFSSSWLPPVFNGTKMNIDGKRVFDIARPSAVSETEQKAFLDSVNTLNRFHRRAYPSNNELESRIANFELAARMQMEIVERTSLAGESDAVRRMYGLDQAETRDYGTCCLLARKLVESGVRFVTVANGGWDHHSNIFPELRKLCNRTDKPVAGLLADLKQRGLLDSTLVVWGGEFGRLPTVEQAGNPNNAGRDHNPFGFTMWMAGGGIKGGVTYGSTDDFGFAAVENKITHSDIHATILHQIGLDFQKLTYDHEGRAESLVGVNPARVLKEIVA